MYVKNNKQNKNKTKKKYKNTKTKQQRKKNENFSTLNRVMKILKQTNQLAIVLDDLFRSLLL